MNEKKLIDEEMLEKTAVPADGEAAMAEFEKRQELFKQQRSECGYSDLDVWGMCSWFTEIIPDMLEQLVENLHGYPGRLNSIEEWEEILRKMIFLLREADEDACTYINPYEDEYERASDKFFKKYGVLGNLFPDGVPDRAENGNYVCHFPGELPEYKELSDNYHAEERRKAEYRNKCKDEAFDLLKEWFWDLWD